MLKHLYICCFIIIDIIKFIISVYLIINITNWKLKFIVSLINKNLTNNLTYLSELYNIIYNKFIQSKMAKKYLPKSEDNLIDFL